MGVFKLGKMTFGSLFKKPETVLYPIETKPQPAGLKGHIAIDAEACILCGMCDKSCTTDCITVDKAARTWAINRYQCIQCGYCTTVCPKKCLHMDPNYAPAATAIVADVVEVPESAEAVAKKPAADKAAEIPVSQVVLAAEAPAPAAEADNDAVLEAKIAIMDPEKAEKVRAALAAR